MYNILYSTIFICLPQEIINVISLPFWYDNKKTHCISTTGKYINFLRIEKFWPQWHHLAIIVLNMNYKDYFVGDYKLQIMSDTLIC
jgi:hypothetical protein